MDNINYCPCIGRDEPYDRSREGWLIHRVCGLVIACDIFTQGIARHPATAVNVGFVTCDRHTETKYLRIWKTEFPMKTGWYWVRNIDAGSGIESERQVVFVSVEKGKIISCTFLGSPAKHEIISAEWQGPIEPHA